MNSSKGSLLFLAMLSPLALLLASTAAQVEAAEEQECEPDPITKNDGETGFVNLIFEGAGGCAAGDPDGDKPVNRVEVTSDDSTIRNQIKLVQLGRDWSDFQEKGQLSPFETSINSF